MYAILVNNDNTLTSTKKERIMQRSKLVNDLWFLVYPIYNGIDLTDCTVLLEYCLPVSKRYKTEILTLSEERYEDHLKYVLPFDTNLTSEAGSIELQLTFLKADLNPDGSGSQQVRKTSTCSVDIVPIAAWSDIIPDSALSALDQRLIKADAQIKQLIDLSGTISENIVDNLKYDANDETLQLQAGGNGIGDKVSVREMLDDGIPVVDMDSVDGDMSGSDTDNKNNCNCGCEDNVVEFGNEGSSSVPSDDDNVIEF